MYFQLSNVNSKCSIYFDVKHFPCLMLATRWSGCCKILLSNHLKFNEEAHMTLILTKNAFGKLFHENFDFASKSIKISPWMIIILKVKWSCVRSSIEENCELIYAEENCLLLISIAMQTVYHNQISLCKRWSTWLAYYVEVVMCNFYETKSR